MENSIYTGLSRQMALRQQMDIVANNVANMSTPGYRGQNMVFAEYLHQPKLSQGKAELGGPLSMVMDYGHYKNTAPGPMKQTGNPLDLALHGPGWFGVQSEDGVKYTRAGNFTLNQLGELVTSAGYPVVDDNGGIIAIPPDAREIRIAANGAISTEDGQIAQLMVVEFENQQGLRATGNGLYESDEDGLPAEQTTVMQGAIEGSNVNPVLEMTRMIDVMRSFQSTQQLLQGEHERQRTMIQRLTQGG